MRIVGKSIKAVSDGFVGVFYLSIKNSLISHVLGLYVPQTLLE
ncbi:MAG: hypothetical protein A49_32800 [Methyloceanibacter sp.]|nr:MAG: hypothetical protein A49_32800 [Methyloceanibacter sp.]